jgi:hypothetical protein
MLKSLLHGQIRSMESAYGYDATYFHDIVDASTAAAVKFALLTPMSNHCNGVPKDAWYAAKLAGALSEDCGPCTQLCVDMAVKGGVETGKLAALIRGDIDAAGTDAALGFRYGIAVATNSDAILPLVDQVRARYGERGLVSLAFVVTSARMYPTLKRALGHGMTCTKIVVSDQPIAVRRAA